MASYCSREDVQAAPDIRATAHESARIDKATQGASRAVERLCLRRGFYPATDTRTIKVDPRNRRVLDLGPNDLQSVTSITDGTTALTVSTDYTLQPFYAGTDSDFTEPYTSVNLEGSPGEDELVIVGVWGYQKVITASTTLATTVTAAVTTIDFVSGVDLGVGFVYQCGSEWFEVTERSYITTGTNLAAAMTQDSADQIITITGVAKGEVLMVGAEKMLVTETTATTVIVDRAYDGSTLAAHDIATPVQAARRATVVRGVLGSTAAIHTAADVISWIEPPDRIRELTTALAVDRILQERAGYARTSGSGDSERDTRTPALLALKDEVVATYGRRIRTVA